jgi:hypothetical protein
MNIMLRLQWDVVLNLLLYAIKIKSSVILIKNIVMEYDHLLGNG